MRAGKVFFKLNCRERSERKIYGKFCTFPPNSSKLRSDYLFSFQKRTNYLFPEFSRSEYLFPKSASPPPPLRIKWSSPYALKIHRSNYKIRLLARKKNRDLILTSKCGFKTSIPQNHTSKFAKNAPFCQFDAN